MYLCIMNWQELETQAQLEQIDRESAQRPVLLFKHSTRCGISSAALGRLERKWQAQDSEKITPYFLDLIRHRDISGAIAAHYTIPHESPQVLLIKNGVCVYSATHLGIDYDEILENIPSE